MAEGVETQSDPSGRRPQLFAPFRYAAPTLDTDAGTGAAGRAGRAGGAAAAAAAAAVAAAAVAAAAAAAAASAEAEGAAEGWREVTPVPADAALAAAAAEVTAAAASAALAADAAAAAAATAAAAAAAAVPAPALWQYTGSYAPFYSAGAFARGSHDPDRIRALRRRNKRHNTNNNNQFASDSSSSSSGGGGRSDGGDGSYYFAGASVADPSLDADAAVLRLGKGLPPVTGSRAHPVLRRLAAAAALHLPLATAGRTAPGAVGSAAFAGAKGSAAGRNPFEYEHAAVDDGFGGQGEKIYSFPLSRLSQEYNDNNNNGSGSNSSSSSSNSSSNHGFAFATGRDPVRQLPEPLFCAPGCPVAWLGDGVCDDACDDAACAFDRGDCALTFSQMLRAARPHLDAAAVAAARSAGPRRRRRRGSNSNTAAAAATTTNTAAAAAGAAAGGFNIQQQQQSGANFVADDPEDAADAAAEAEAEAEAKQDDDDDYDEEDDGNGNGGSKARSPVSEEERLARAAARAATEAAPAEAARARRWALRHLVAARAERLLLKQRRLRQVLAALLWDLEPWGVRVGLASAPSASGAMRPLSQTTLDRETQWVNATVPAALAVIDDLGYVNGEDDNAETTDAAATADAEGDLSSDSTEVNLRRRRHRDSAGHPDSPTHSAYAATAPPVRLAAGPFTEDRPDVPLSTRRVLGEALAAWTGSVLGLGYHQRRRGRRHDRDTHAANRGGLGPGAGARLNLHNSSSSSVKKSGRKAKEAAALPMHAVIAGASDPLDGVSAERVSVESTASVSGNAKTSSSSSVYRHGYRREETDEDNEDDDDGDDDEGSDGNGGRSGRKSRHHVSFATAATTADTDADADASVRAPVSAGLTSSARYSIQAAENSFSSLVRAQALPLSLTPLAKRRSNSSSGSGSSANNHDNAATSLSASAFAAAFAAASAAAAAPISTLPPWRWPVDAAAAAPTVNHAVPPVRGRWWTALSATGALNHSQLVASRAARPPDASYMFVLSRSQTLMRKLLPAPLRMPVPHKPQVRCVLLDDFETLNVVYLKLSECILVIRTVLYC